MPDATDRSAAATRARARNFSARHAADSPFEPRGLRAYFEYRDLGIAKASRGGGGPHDPPAGPGRPPTGEWHAHDCELQFFYVLKGWIRFEYEGVGVVTAKAGSCVWQPPGIRHRELAHSKNVELIEVVSPGRFRTVALPQDETTDAAGVTRPTRATGARMATATTRAKWPKG
jgi:mannose-6-phosphate isomerase-like protein (cupin superfamily)